MSHVPVENYALFASNDQFSAVWKMTRAMKTAGWRYKASSNGLNAKDSTGVPSSDVWGGGGIVQGPTTVSFTIGAPNSTAFGGRSTITGLAGMATTSVGHFLVITGATNPTNNGTWLITKFISATSVQIENPTAIAEVTPGTATYTETSALLDTYPITGQASGAWWCAQGPSTMKVPIGTSLPTGTFIKGENVTQTTTGATGEIIGVYTDTVYGGYLVICPRVSGTGGDPRGWDHANVITGSVSGATITPTATVIEYVREVVFWYNNITTGHIFYQCIDVVNESAVGFTTGRFSTMASTVIGGADYIHCPGAIAGNNPNSDGFPTVGTFAVIGQAGSGTAATNPLVWCSDSTTLGTGKAQILCANCIEDANISADGSCTWAIGNQSSSTTIAALSNGLSLPQATINVAANSPFLIPGTILVTTSLGPQAVTVTNTSGGTQFTGCAGGSGVMSTGGLVTGGYFVGMGFLRVDDTEDADVDPYVWAAANAAAGGNYKRNRTGDGAGNVASSSIDLMNATAATGGFWHQQTQFMGWRRRGMGTSPVNPNYIEGFTEYYGFSIGLVNSSRILENGTGPDTVACNAATVTVREPFYLVASNQTFTGFQGYKQRKGTTRWWHLVMNGSATDTYDGKQWIQLSSRLPAIVVGPADGTTVPANQ